MRIPFPSRSELLPQRFLYFGGETNPEGQSPDEGSGGGVKVSEAAAEAAAEDRRQARQAVKKQRGEEKKVKKREYKLAGIIEQFLRGKSRDDKLALLISRLVERNVPVSIVLAVLSLNYQEAIADLEDYLDEEAGILSDEEMDAVSAESREIVQFGREMSQALSEWTKRIFTHASFRPMKAVLTLAHHHGVDHGMVQLTALMIQHYFQGIGQEVEFERMKEFSELFWKDALKRLHKLADQRGLLAERVESSSSEKDDEEDDDEDWGDDDNRD
ncbi:MAG: hypothetical protein Q8P95_05510 [bacterium]|nr:hypothetical protein [bacterium]